MAFAQFLSRLAVSAGYVRGQRRFRRAEHDLRAARDELMLGAHRKQPIAQSASRGAALGSMT